MKFYSTNNQDNQVDFDVAVRRGLAFDRGLYMPASIPQLNEEFIKALDKMALPQIAIEILKPFVSGHIADERLEALSYDAFDFNLPLVEVEKNLYALELYHGPTLAFKDFGARFMARTLGELNAGGAHQNTMLVATSGDTGSAVASGFYKVPNTQVVILYPKGKVSALQEKQMTTLGENIKAIAIDGTFDDCQRLVKEAFMDRQLSEKLGLTSANSINLARLLPQMLYYFYAVGQLRAKGKPIVFSVPSGNYGNLTAGLIANKMGLPIEHFLAASNANKIVPDYLHTGEFKPKPSIKTISNAMDVGDPSNFARMYDLFGGQHPAFLEKMTGYNYSDNETRTAIKELKERCNYIADPHGAIGYMALKEYMAEHEVTGIFLETAHPIKFRDEVEPVIEVEIQLPYILKNILDKDVKASQCGKTFNEFKAALADIL
jgi:threonine synthase